MAGNAECKKEGHEMHMCALQAEGFEIQAINRESSI